MQPLLERQLSLSLDKFDSQSLGVRFLVNAGGFRGSSSRGNDLGSESTCLRPEVGGDDKIGATRFLISRKRLMG